MAPARTPRSPQIASAGTTRQTVRSRSEPAYTEAAATCFFRDTITISNTTDTSVTARNPARSGRYPAKAGLDIQAAIGVRARYRIAAHAIARRASVATTFV